MRDAADVVTTAPTRAVLATDARPRLDQCLHERGLARSAAKTRIGPITAGVNFLGFHRRTCGQQGTWLTGPPQEKVLKHVRAVRADLDAQQPTPAEPLIKALNPVRRGWAHSDRHGAAKHVLHKVRQAHWQMLWTWAKRRPPKQSRQWVKARYVQNDGYGTCWAGQAALVKPDAPPITRCTQVAGRHAPYDPALRQDWTERKKQHVGRETSKKPRLILPQKQGDRCALCHLPFLVGESLETAHSLKSNTKRLVHPWCQRQRHQKDGRQRTRA